MTARRWLLGSGVGMVVGSIAPWASLVGEGQASGLRVHFGWLTLVAGIVVAIPRVHRHVVLALAAVSALLCVLVALAVGSTSDYGTSLAPGWGVFLTLGASLVAAFHAARARPETE